MTFVQVEPRTPKDVNIRSSSSLALPHVESCLSNSPTEAIVAGGAHVSHEIKPT